MVVNMKAVDIRGGKGGSDALFINNEVSKPYPVDGQALVQIRAFGINRMDIIQRQGGYPLPPQAPTTLGVEFSGVIESFGSDLHDGFSEGDEVIGLAYGGAYAEYVAVSTRMLLHKPSSMDWATGASIPETWMTATQALHQVLEFTKGKSVLWHAGASGVSIAGIQLSRIAGASHVYATAGSEEKCQFITKELGATAAFNYKTQNWEEEIKKYTNGKGVDYIVDFVGGSYFQQNILAAARDGRIVILGILGGERAPEVEISEILYKRLRIEGSTLRSRDEKYQGRIRDRLERYLPSFQSGQLKVYIDKVLRWENISKAHERIEGSKIIGKVICTIY